MQSSKKLGALSGVQPSPVVRASTPAGTHSHQLQTHVREAALPHAPVEEVEAEVVTPEVVTPEDVTSEVVTPEVVTLSPKKSGKTQPRKGQAAASVTVEPVAVEATEISADEADAARIRYGLEHSFAQHFGAPDEIASQVVPREDPVDVEVLSDDFDDDGSDLPVVSTETDESADSYEVDSGDEDTSYPVVPQGSSSRALVRVSKGSSLGAFMQAAKREPMLTPEEEHKLALRFRDFGDLDAARKLVTSHLRLVISVARNYAGYGLPLPDLIQEGNIGLMKAVRHFNPDVGVRLAAFAVHWIKAEILDYVLRNWRMVKVATTKAQRKLFFTLRELKLRLGWFTNDEREEVANVLGVTPHEVAEMETRMAGSDMSFDADSNDDSSTAAALPSPASYLEDENSNFAQVLENSDYTNWQVTKLKEALASLDERSRHILKRRWLDEDKATLQELSHELGVSIERVRQIENNALGKIKNILLQEGVAPEGVTARLTMAPEKKKKTRAQSTKTSKTGRALSVVQRTKTKSATTKSGATKGIKATTSAAHKADLHSAHVVVTPQDDAADVPNVSLKQVATTVTKAQTTKVNQATKLSKAKKTATDLVPA